MVIKTDLTALHNCKVWVTLLFLFCLAAAVLLSGCEGLEKIAEPEPEQLPLSQFSLPEAPPPLPDAGDERLGTLYYADSQFRFLVPVMRSIPWVEGIAASTLSHLFPSAETAEALQKMGLTTVLPAQTKINGISINEGRARVDLSAEFINYVPEHERLVLGSILCTLRQFPTIETVEILVEGANLDKFPGGAPGRLPLGPECYINLEMDDSVEDYRNYTAVKLFYCYLSPGGRALYVPVTRVLQPVEDVYTAALQELLQGPRKGSGLFSSIPAGTELLSFDLSDEVAVVNFSEELLAYEGGRSGVENMVHQILLTLAALEDIEQVQILVEGARVTLEGLDLSSSLLPPQVYNYF